MQLEALGRTSIEVSGKDHSCTDLHLENLLVYRILFADGSLVWCDVLRHPLALEPLYTLSSSTRHKLAKLAVAPKDLSRCFHELGDLHWSEPEEKMKRNTIASENGDVQTSRIPTVVWRVAA